MFLGDPVGIAAETAVTLEERTIPMITTLHDPIPGWPDLLAAHPSATVYHTAAWKAVIEGSFRGLEPCYLARAEPGNPLAMLVPGFVSRHAFREASFVSLPLTGYCDPLSDSSEPLRQGFEVLTARQQRGSFAVAQLRCLTRQPEATEAGFSEHIGYVTHVVDVSRSPAELRRSFHNTSVQQRIRKAEEAGLGFEVANTGESLDVFYNLHSVSRRHRGLPPLPYRFFERMCRLLLPLDLMSFLLVRHEGRYISAMVLLKFGKYAHSEYTGTDPRFLSVNPNQFINWKAIEYANQEGYRYYDFGRSALANAGLVEFKDRWASQKIPLYYYFYPPLPEDALRRREMRKAGILGAACRRAPIRLLRAASTALYDLIV